MSDVKYISTISHKYRQTGSSTTTTDTFAIRARTLDSYDYNNNAYYASGTVPKADGAGGITWSSLGSGVTDIKSADGSKTADGEIQVGGGLDLSSNKIIITSLPYQTSTPTAENSTNLKIVILTGIPDTYYKGYLYFIQES